MFQATVIMLREGNQHRAVNVGSEASSVTVQLYCLTRSFDTIETNLKEHWVPACTLV